MPIKVIRSYFIYYLSIADWTESGQPIEIKRICILCREVLTSWAVLWFFVVQWLVTALVNATFFIKCGFTRWRWKSTWGRKGSRYDTWIGNSCVAEVYTIITGGTYVPWHGKRIRFQTLYLSPSSPSQIKRYWKEPIIRTRSLWKGLWIGSFLNGAMNNHNIQNLSKDGPFLYGV